MIDRIQYPFQNDHDVFIALIEDFNQSIAEIQKRMLENHQDTVEIKGLLQEQYSVLSERITKVEKQFESLNPEELASMKKEVGKLKQWRQDFKTTKHLAWITASVFFGVIGYLINYIFPHLRLTH